MKRDPVCFSTMKRVNTKLRNRMDWDFLDALMRLSIEGPSMEMDFAAALDKFAT